MSLLSYDPFFEYVLDTPRVFSPLGFGFDPFEELTPFTSPFGLPRRFTPRGMRAPTTRPTTREVISDKDKYQVTLNLSDFKANEINVKMVDNSLLVCAEHEEKPDDVGHVYRHIRRRYMLPRNVDADKLNASLSDNGTLIICAPKKAIEPANEREIEIKQLPAESTQASTQMTQQSEQPGGQINIPVSHEKANK